MNLEEKFRIRKHVFKVVFPKITNQITIQCSGDGYGDDG